MCRWPPRTSYGSNANDHPITYCSQLNPIRDSLWSPPLEDQGPSIDTHQPTQPHGPADSCYGNSHITGLGIRVSGSCGQPNETIQTGCVICGKSSADIKEGKTLGFLEQTHTPGETNEQRIARRDAFQAGMKAGTFILVPGGVSQAAACDGILYQIMPENNETLPAPGVLPI